PNVKNQEPLKGQAAHFMDCITRRRKPLSDAAEGLAVVETLEAVEKILARQRGK
ncbi:MAG: gfo/Idh/MocA family oxidoreductase, partial [Candidatus Omnitrophica bacterium]|nr:gfo/Idh/MocA family oxidoreductase [Candidatus Omnitrophota bacterium]